MNDIEQDRPDPVAPGPADVPVAASGELPAEPVSLAPRPAQTRHPSLLELFTNPRGFFEALETQPVSLGMPSLIVDMVAILGALTAYLSTSMVFSKVSGQLAGQLAGMGTALGAGIAVGTFFGIIFVWIIIAAVFFLLSMAFNGRGDFNRLLAYVGYGHIPQVIGGVITLALTWNYYSNLRIPPLTTPEAIQEWATSINSDPAMQLATVIGLLFLLWSANIWIFGVRTGRMLSTRNAAITVAVPLLVYILFVYVVLPLVM